MGAKLGVNAKTYFLDDVRTSWGGTPTAGVLVGVGAQVDDLEELANVKDVSLPLEDTESDATTRANGGYEAIIPAIRKLGLTLPQVYDTGDGGCEILKKAYLTRVTIPLAILDGPATTVGAEGLWADFAVVKMEKGEPIDGHQTINFSLKFGYSAVHPEWVQVAAP